jgi:hypothetical protein
MHIGVSKSSTPRATKFLILCPYKKIKAVQQNSSLKNEAKNQYSRWFQVLVAYGFVE